MPERSERNGYNDEEIIVFETVGVAAQDLTAAKAIYEKAVAAGIGTQWN